MTTFSSTQTKIATAIIALASFVAIAATSVGAMWIVGTFGVSTATASAIVKAVEVGSWGMFLAAIATTGGIIGAGLWAVIKTKLAQMGTKAVVA
ncbi:hypothetical protein [Corynebacterium liangguodongii]|uniref:Uncharacterized protein n=1 Tax=Corynebacterium liangguodongii TaxID=2079535 RepID=A0A2S0WC65_9CORY|nr:hypothetical protein [Corynebacterium liangguodongii]AWB83353.1 hypothetical protein C3E79_01670 [Corynebacterium liangguodongii]PWC00557.1 hypothetical protein DF219_01280 [Corynebacterium liangguodongii]